MITDPVKPLTTSNHELESRAGDRLILRGLNPAGTGEILHLTTFSFMALSPKLKEPEHPTSQHLNSDTLTP